MNWCNYIYDIIVYIYIYLPSYIYWHEKVFTNRYKYIEIRVRVCAPNFHHYELTVHRSTNGLWLFGDKYLGAWWSRALYVRSKIWPPIFQNKLLQFFQTKWHPQRSRLLACNGQHMASRRLAAKLAQLALAWLEVDGTKPTWKSFGTCLKSKKMGPTGTIWLSILWLLCIVHPMNHRLGDLFAWSRIRGNPSNSLHWGWFIIGFTTLLKLKTTENFWRGWQCCDVIWDSNLRRRVSLTPGSFKREKPLGHIQWFSSTLKTVNPVCK